MLAAASVVGPSFEPGLQPRSTLHQAAATGVIAATTLGVVTLGQSALTSAGRLITHDRDTAASSLARLVINAAGDAAVAGTGFAIAAALPPRDDESFARGLVRVTADRGARVALVAMGLTVGMGTASLVSQANPRADWLRGIPVSFGLGVATAAWGIHRARTRTREAGDTTVADVSVGTSAALAVGVGAGIAGIQLGQRAIAHAAASLVRRAAPGLEPVAAPLGHLASLAVLGGALATGYEYAVRAVEQGGAAVEPAYESPPESRAVSGGPASLVTFESLSREGRRFVNMALTGQEIAEVMGEPAAADPIRVFVGLAAAPDVDERVRLAMEELTRTGAFDRSLLCLASPTGSGYVNYVMAETLEFLARGDCAIVTLQYSLRPSFLSLDRAGLGLEQNAALLHAISERLRRMPEDRRPRLLLFGESLGAFTLLDLYRHRDVGALDRDLIDSSIFLGAPAGTQFARSWRRDPARLDPDGRMVDVDSHADYRALPAERRDRVRHVMLTHHDDPIPKFEPSLLIRQPDWLGDRDDRPAGVPKSTAWRPATTFVLTGIDLLNAMEVVPGSFGRRGHDYREDIPEFVRDVYRLPATDEQMAAIEGRLRARELAWAGRRVITEQLARARESVRRTIETWGVGPDQVDAASILRELADSLGPASGGAR